MRSAILAEPRLIEFSTDEPKVFVIEGMNGRVRQHNALSGGLDWQFDCRDGVVLTVVASCELMCSEQWYRVMLKSIMLPTSVLKQLDYCFNASNCTITLPG
jgi:hypothetical protein